METEHTLARFIMGGESNPLMTDGYKFSMAQAGFPLREETFYFTCRKGDPLYIPFDLAAVVREFLPKRLPNGKERAFLATHGYGLTPAMEEALLGDVSDWCPSPGSWVLPGEPILTATGPSFLVSWLEPLVIMLHFPLQVASCLHRVKTDVKAYAPLANYTPSCKDEWRIFKAVAALADIKAPSFIESFYEENVERRLFSLMEALGGNNLDRAFEVGMRAATCMEQHGMAIRACNRMGLTKTSNVYKAWRHYMIPVGTTGHEHQMRWSVGRIGDDDPGFRAIRDMRPEPPSYLFDTFDPINLGLPAAFRVIDEIPERPCSLRFDSGDQDVQFQMVLDHFGGKRHLPNIIFEDGYTAARTEAMERFCEERGWPQDKRMYGFGGFIVQDPELNRSFNRNNVSAVYKLCQSGGRPVMKFSGSKGKRSLPGKPVVLVQGSSRYIAQEGEDIRGHGRLDHLPNCPMYADSKTKLSPQTECLINTAVGQVASKRRRS